LPEATVSAEALCICGLAAEAKIARAAGFSVVIGAGNRSRTAALVESAVGRANCLSVSALPAHSRRGCGRAT